MTDHGEEGRGPGQRPIEVNINGKTVILSDHRMTGLEIKEAAVAQGVIPDVGFQLSEERPNGELVHVRDDETVTVTRHSQFLAVAPDDNS
ncbi:multiubiquitin domain-containing protein [Promicromonospora panici]|uniref:multiubiquitin domain-containing protein n=1 Tax=Promicromonospora panici TaxID=2219658 RepID=UPI00101D6430|nr:multiubiquitin domain-containing protein [Promicromonospora panici]